MSLENRLKLVNEKIGNAALKAGRNIDDIKLIAVSKKMDPKRIIEAANSGVLTLGENYAQEFRDKYPIVEEGVSANISWHFIGQLQKNKVKYIMGKVNLIHSLDSVSVAKEINKRAGSLDIKMPVLIEVDTGEEEEKGGVAYDKVEEFLNRISSLQSITVKGLMTMPPFFDDPEMTRPYFKKLRDLRDKLVANHPDLKELSMGMSGDFEVAIEEGATYVRVGTAIFGPRL